MSLSKCSLSNVLLVNLFSGVNIQLFNKQVGELSNLLLPCARKIQMNLVEQCRSCSAPGLQPFKIKRHSLLSGGSFDSVIVLLGPSPSLKNVKQSYDMEMFMRA